uniref:Uncharacterized protein n=1 Tax=Ditylenchus dipsaci TaxID=166011 RepID=A0A915E0G4_9BILA
MASLEFMHSKRIGNKRMAITYCPADESNCYTWSSYTRTRSIRKDGVKLLYYVCSECRSIREKGLVFKSQKLLTMKADEVISKWIDSVPNHPHFCEGRKVSEVKGISLRRSMQAEMASGSNQTVSSAIVRIERRL